MHPHFTLVSLNAFKGREGVLSNLQIYPFMSLSELSFRGNKSHCTNFKTDGLSDAPLLLDSLRPLTEFMAKLQTERGWNTP